MYRVSLTESYFPAQADDVVLETTVGGLLRTQAQKTPHAGALVEADLEGRIGRAWTYGELFSDAERLAGALLSRYRPGERICVWAPNIPEWVILEYAAALAGLTLVTANPAYRPRELKFVLEQSRSVGLFLVKEHRGNPMAEIAAEVAREVKLREVVDMEDHAALFAGAASAALPEVRPDDPVQIQYTSGTTGFPKGAVLHHRGVTNNARFCVNRRGAQPGETILNFMPMFHTAGCGLAALGAVQFGGRMILARLFDPGRMLDIVESERVASLLGVPTMLVALCEAQTARPRDVSSLRLAASGGSMVAPDLVRRVRTLFKCDFQTVYGQTETSPLLTQARSDDSLEDLCETVGQALPQTELSIRDTQTNQVTPVGTVGEICARGYCVMLGYNDNPEANAKTIDAEGWLHTGDLGTMDARGYVKITGRVKEMIIRGGENLFPAEIENVLLEHPDVAEVAVVGAPDERWGEIVVCFLRLRDGAALDKAALVAHCRERISPQKTPAHWVEVSEWPLTGSGKIQKFVLRDRFVSGELACALTTPVAVRAGASYLTTMRPNALVHPRPEGLYVPAADLYVDPVRPVTRALITHGHADHARAGHGAVLATPETLAIMAVRYGPDFAGGRQELAYGETLTLGGVRLSLKPAGHVLGSAQAAIERDGVRIVVSGDYKRQPDPTCAPFEIAPCDVFISEATFALPVFTHPSAEAEIRKLIASAAMFPDRAHIVGAYALGKAQRVIATLRACGWDRPVYAHGALLRMIDLYRAHGVALGDVRPVIDAPKAAYAGEVIICPPSALQTPWVRRFPEPVTAFASGWMRIRARARQRGVELPLVISDHADWPDLQRTIKETCAPEIWITHGEADALAHWCKAEGLAAKALHMVGYGDDDEPADQAA